MSVVTTSIHARLDTLAPRLHAISLALSYQSPGLTASDLFQSMLCNLLDRAAQDPTFFEQRDAYLCQYADWHARHLAEASRIYTRFVGEETPLDVDDEDLETDFDLIAAHDPDPESAVIEREFREVVIQTIRRLSDANQELVGLLISGYSQIEIATRLGISEGAVSQRKATIRRAFAASLLLP